MTLSKKRREFTKLLARLVNDINQVPGYEACLGEVLRPISLAAEYEKHGVGIKNSLHVLGLAADVQIFKDNAFLTKTEEYEFAGKIWEGYSHDDIECSWGGHFDDGNHFSVVHGGVK